MIVIEKTKMDIDDTSSRLERKNQFDGNLRFGNAIFHSKTNRTGVGRPSSGFLIREHAKVVIDTGIERYQRKEDFFYSIDSCPICGSTNSKHLLTRFGLDIWRCQDCKHGFQNPRLKYDKATELYMDDQSASDIYTSPLQIEIDEIKYQYGVDLIGLALEGVKHKILDIGCGAGVFLKIAHNSGWPICVGVDPNENYSKIYAESKGVQYIQGTLEKLDEYNIGSNYDCISMWSVLEHMNDPKKVVEKISSILTPEGVIFILVPNLDSLATRLMRQISPTFAWKHPNYFCKESLVTLMDKGGFKPVLMETVITEIDNIKNYMSFEWPYDADRPCDNAFDLITPEWIHKNMLGSRLIGIFKRK
jgi:2-polyprenyl-3-methyl-5-hydroxy-6-metoxy-1,4-benzoquinol methylase